MIGLRLGWREPLIASHENCNIFWKWYYCTIGLDLMLNTMTVLKLDSKFTARLPNKESRIYFKFCICKSTPTLIHSHTVRLHWGQVRGIRKKQLPILIPIPWSPFLFLYSTSWNLIKIWGTVISVISFF